jgi:heme-degrading monooxygenase HmoA
MVVIVWEYAVRPGREEDFTSMYRPDGLWGDLFRESPAFVSITLMRDLRDPRRFFVADRWTSEILYEEFKQAHAAAYRELSGRGRRLIERETEVGRFDFLE